MTSKENAPDKGQPAGIAVSKTEKPQSVKSASAGALSVPENQDEGKPKLSLEDMIERAMQPLFRKFSEFESKIEALNLMSVPKLQSSSYDQQRGVGASEESFHSPQEFSSRRVDHRPNRQSLGSYRSIDSQDVVVRNVQSSFRLDKPKFESPVDPKNDGAFDESVLKFIEACDRHIEIWLNLPENENKQFQGSEVFALVTLPPEVQRRVAHNLEMIYDKSDVFGWTLREIQAAESWDKATTDGVKRAILERRARGGAKKDVVKTIQPPAISWPPGIGLIHLDGFEEYKSKLTTQVSRLADGGVSLSFITIKDAIISAIPDRDFRIELYTQFGHSGSLPGPTASGVNQEFSMKSIFDFIRDHIVVVKQKGLAEVVNQKSKASFTPPTSRKFVGQGPPSRFPARAVHAIEFGSEFPESDRDFWESGHYQERMAKEDDEYTSVNQVVQDAKSKDCRHIGIGPDGKLLCPYLGNPASAKCGFRHPSKDLELKGKGVSKSVPAKPLKVHSAEGLGISYVHDSEFQNENDADDS